MISDENLIEVAEVFEHLACPLTHLPLLVLEIPRLPVVDQHHLVKVLLVPLFEDFIHIMDVLPCLGEWLRCIS